MSTPSLNARRSDPQATPPPADSFDPARFSELAAALQHAATVFAGPCGAAASDATPAVKRRSRHAGQPVRPVPHEIRSYRVPSFIAQFEKEALAAHNAEDLSELFEHVYCDLYVTAYLMGHFNDAEEVGGQTIQMIGNKLHSALAVLSKGCTVLADFKPMNQPATA